MYTWALGRAIHTASEVVADYRSLRATEEARNSKKQELETSMTHTSLNPAIAANGPLLLHSMVRCMVKKWTTVAG